MEKELPQILIDSSPQTCNICGLPLYEDEYLSILQCINPYCKAKTVKTIWNIAQIVENTMTEEEICDIIDNEGLIHPFEILRLKGWTLPQLTLSEYMMLYDTPIDVSALQPKIDTFTDLYEYYVALDNENIFDEQSDLPVDGVKAINYIYLQYWKQVFIRGLEFIGYEDDNDDEEE